MNIQSVCQVPQTAVVPCECCVKNRTTPDALVALAEEIDALKSRFDMSESIQLELENAGNPFEPISSNSRTIFPWDKIYIKINREWLKLFDTDAGEFVLLHELSHIKQRDGNKTFIIQSAVLTVLFSGIISIPTSMPLIGAYSLVGLSWIVSRVGISIFSMLTEMRTDKEAFQASSEQGKRAASTFVNALASYEDSLGFWARVSEYTKFLLLPQGIQHSPPELRSWFLRKISS
jgi:hypothetical protein